MSTIAEYSFTFMDLNDEGKFVRTAEALDIAQGQPIVQLYDNNGVLICDGSYWTSYESQNVSIQWLNRVLTIDLSSLLPITGTWSIKFDRDSSYVPKDINSNTQVLSNEFLICKAGSLIVTSVVNPVDTAHFKISTQSFDPIIVMPSGDCKIAGMESLVLRKNSLAEFIYDADANNWDVVILSAVTPTTPDVPANSSDDLIAHTSNVRNKDEFMDYILRKLGWPLISVELTDEQLSDAINDAVIEFAEYAFSERKFLAIDMNQYISGVGIQCPKGVMGISNITSNLVGPNGLGSGNIDSYMNDLIANGAIGFPLLGRANGTGWFNYELAMGYLDFSQKMLGGDYDYNYNFRTRYLTLYPDPIKTKQKRGWLVATCSCLNPDNLQYGDSWIKRMALAMAKITLGRIYTKFKGINFPAGGSLSEDIGSEGSSEVEALRTELRERYPVIDIFMA